MDILRLTLTDFCGHSFSDIDFAGFSTALIMGKRNGNDRISNAVGKSTIFAAIKYVLFNEIDFSTLEKVIRHGTDRCNVILEFATSDGSKYKVSRTKSRKTSSDLMFYRWNDEWVDITQRKPTDTEIDIQKVIKINYKTFCNTVLFSQAEILYGLGALTPTARKIALKDALQLNVYSALEKLAKKKTSELLKDIDTSKVILSTIGDPETDIKNIERGIASKGAEITKIKDDSKNIEQVIEIFKKQVEEAKSAYTKLDDRSKADRKNSKDIENDIAIITKTITEIENKLSLLLHNKTSITKEIEEMDKYNIQYANIDNIFLEINDKLSTISNIIGDKKAASKALAIRLEELKIPLPKEGICKHCRQAMSVEHRETCKQSILLDIATTEKQYSEMIVELNKLQAEEKTFALHKQKAQDIKEKTKLNENTLQSKHNEYLSISERTDELYFQKSEYEKHINTISKELKEIKTRLMSFSKEYQEALDYLKVREEGLQNHLNDYNDNRNSISAIESQIAVLNDNKNRRLQDQQKLFLLNEDIKKSEVKYSLHQDVVQAFGSSGIPALITHTILDDFQIETNALLTQLKPGLQSKFSIQKSKDNGDDKDTLDISYVLDGYDLEYAQLSGAQKLIASLCLKLGLSAVIKKRLGIDIKILLIDEIDQSLDDESLDAFEDAIKRLQNDYKILVITHKKELKERFTTAIVVEQDENFISTAKVSNVW